MNFTIPRNDSTEFLIYIWKIIDVPEIRINELLFKITFEFFLLPPEKALKFIHNSIKNQHLKKNKLDYLSLSQALYENLSVWHKSRKNEIFSRLEKKRKKKLAYIATKDDDIDDFNILIKAFSEKGTSNRAATVANTDLNVIEFDHKNGKIKIEVKGSRKESYFIEINSKEKILRHDCHDFITRRAENKKFCKHLVKLFLFLKERNEEATLNFLKLISENINNWDFSG
jgi:hypothetical protein